MFIPSNFRLAARRALFRLLWLIPLGIWEVAKDRAANMANKQIDDSSGPFMKEAVRMLEWMADQPLTWTLILAVIIVLFIFLHAYLTEPRGKQEAIKDRSQHLRFILNRSRRNGFG